MLTPDAVAASDLERILILLQRGIGSNPQACSFRHSLGGILYRAGKFDMAVSELKEAMKLHGGEGRPEDWFFLAMAHQRLNQVEEARQALEKAVRQSEKADQEKPDTSAPPPFPPGRIGSNGSSCASRPRPSSARKAPQVSPGFLGQFQGRPGWDSAGQQARRLNVALCKFFKA